MLRRAAALAAGLALGACSAVGIRAGTEEPRFDVVERLAGGVEVRRYGERLAAETVVAGGDGGRARGEAFRVLAGYIFGRNRGNAGIAMTAPVEVAGRGQKIAMTAPVAVAAGEGGLLMRFFMPAAYTRATLPEPADPRVRIVEVPAGTVAVLRYTGSTSPGAAAARAADLLASLEGSGWRATGAPTNLFYDPPWTVPFLRRNEVAVPVARER